MNKRDNNLGNSIIYSLIFPPFLAAIISDDLKNMAHLWQLMAYPIYVCPTWNHLIYLTSKECKIQSY